MNTAQKFRKIADGYEPPKHSHRIEDFKRNFKMKRIRRKCLKQIKLSARRGLTYAVVTNFDYNMHGWNLLFEEQYLIRMVDILEKDGFKTTDAYLIANIPKEWREKYWTSVFDEYALTKAACLMRCLVVEF